MFLISTCDSQLLWMFHTISLKWKQITKLRNNQKNYILYLRFVICTFTSVRIMWWFATYQVPKLNFEFIWFLLLASSPYHSHHRHEDSMSVLLATASESSRVCQHYNRKQSTAFNYTKCNESSKMRHWKCSLKTLNISTNMYSECLYMCYSTCDYNIRLYIMLVVIH